MMRLQKIAVRSLSATCLVLLTLAGQVFPQHPNHERGLNAHSYLSGDFDHVNLYNGNLTLTVPIGQSYRVGGGLDYKLTLVYNSNAWYFKQGIQPGHGERVKAEPNPKANAGMGWTLSLGALYPPNTEGYNDDPDKQLYVAPDGSEHLFHSELYPGRTQPGMSFTNDGTYLRLRAEGGLRKIEFPNGQVHTFGSNNLLSRIEDRFGNTLDVDTTSTPWQWVLKEKCNSCSTYTRQHRIVFNGGRVDEVRLAAFTKPGESAREAVYDFLYTQMNIWRHEKDTWVRDSQYLDVWVLTGLQLPANAGSYSFGYNDNTVNVYSGLIKSATLPTRGHYEWAYQLYTRPVNVLDPTPVCTPYCPDMASPVSSSDGIRYKRIFNRPNGTLLGSFEYTLGESTPTEADPNGWTSVTVRSPEGDETVNYFDISFDSLGYNVWSFGLPINTKKSVESPQGTLYLSQEIYKGPVAGGQKLRSVYLQYDGDPKAGFNDRANNRVTAQRTVYEDGLFADVYYKDWNGLGKFQTTVTGGNFASGNARTTFVNYSTAMPAANAPWVLGLYTSEDITEGSATAKTSFCFDPNTGFLRRKRTYKGATIAPQDIFVEYAADADGNVASEKYYGGDKQGSAPQAGICAAFSAAPEYVREHTYQYGSLATSKIAGQNFFTTDNTIEQRTGLVSESRDGAGVATKFDYDALGRVTKVDSFADADTYYTYTPAAGSTGAQARIERKVNEGDAVPLTESQITFDPFGRQARLSDRMPDGTLSTRETKYNAVGWVTSASTFGDVTKKTEYSLYDPFGRAGKIVAPDGSETLFDHTGVSRTQRTVKIGTSRDAAGNVLKTPASTYEFYDRQGRLQSVQEDSGPNNAPRATSYQYDVGNRLRQVSINYTDDPDVRTNVAHAAHGAQAFASSTLDSRFPAGAAINGDHMGVGWGAGTGGWADGTADAFPDTLEVHFAGEKTINEIDVYTLQDDPAHPVEPALSTTFGLYGVVDFDVRYFNGATGQWVNAATIRGNNKVWRQIILPAPVRTQKISVVVHRAVSGSNPKNYSRVVEVEAYTAPPGGPTRQVRTFNYDNRGFLFSETHPEIGGAVTYGEYDTLGNVGRKAEGGNALLYAYDGAGRLVQVTEEATGRVLKEFDFYEFNGAGGNFTLGKLKKATRHNWVRNPYAPSPGSPELQIKISEEYTYAGREGRPDSRLSVLHEDAVDQNGAPKPMKFRQTFAYDALGNISSQSYPRCENATCTNSGAATPRTVRYAYTNGYMTRVWRSSAAGDVNYATAIGYHANRAVNTVQHGNGVTDTYARSADNNLPRPHQITFAGAAVNWTTGAYEYDGAGNVVKMGADWFLYDRANRVKEGTAGVGYNGVRRKQGYTFDTMGNLLTITTTNEDGTNTYTNAVDPATNRLAFYYDAAGNFLGAQNADELQYDPLNMMKKLPGKTYLYGPGDERVWVVDVGYDDRGPRPPQPPAVIQTITLRGLGNEVLREYTVTGTDEAGNWSWARDYIYRGGALLSSETAAHGRLDYHVDHLGTPRVMTTATGGRWGYGAQYLYPFGAEAETLPDSRLRFTGHERDDNTFTHRLDYMHARFYGFNNGRFLSVDPGRDFDPKQPQSWNRYSYARGNPVNAVDPDGRFFTTVINGTMIEALRQAPTDGVAPDDSASYQFTVTDVWKQSKSDKAMSLSCFACIFVADVQAQQSTWKPTPLSEQLTVSPADYIDELITDSPVTVLNIAKNIVLKATPLGWGITGASTFVLPYLRIVNRQMYRAGMGNPHYIRERAVDACHRSICTNDTMTQRGVWVNTLDLHITPVGNLRRP